MKKSTLLFLFCTLIVSLTQAQVTLDRGVLASGFDQLLKTHLANNKWQGQVVVNQGGEIIYSNSNGFANFSNKRPYTDSTRFAIASITKVFTASAIMILDQEGKLDLQDAVKDYLPAYQKYPTVTIEHLVRHCSGLAYGSWHLRKKLKLNEQDTLTYTMVNEWVANNYKDLYFEPGTQNNYSNIAYRALAAIVEELSGISYPQFLQEKIFDPLGMNSAVFLPNVLLEDRAGFAKPFLCITGKDKEKPYTFGKGHIDYLYPSTDYGSFGLYMSLADLTKVRRLWGSKEVFSKETLSVLTGIDTFPSGKPNYYRYGYVSTKTPILESWNLRSSGNILGFISFVIYFPEFDLSIAMSTNRYPMINKTYADGELIDFYAEIKPILYESFGLDYPKLE